LINPGNSGGALVDINGKVIGINNIYVAQLAAIGFAVPINLAKSIAFKLVKDGKIKRGFVGIWSEKKGITKEIQEAMNLPSTDGVLIQEIEPGSPAEKAGLNHGDVIITLDGVKIKNFQDFLFKIAEHAPGDTVTLEILRNGTKQEMKLTLADSDDFMNVTAGYSSENAWRGINVADLNSQIAQQYNLDGIENGVVVVKIDKNSPAEDSNLAEGDVIIEIEGRSVKDVKDFNSIKNDVKNTKKPILIYRLRKTSNGIMKGYVAVKSE
jgi:S1-C subfamily serine protease